MKIVILDGYTENPGDLSWDALGQLGQLTVYDRSAPEEVVSRIGDAEIVLTNKTVINEAILAQCPNVQYIGVLATGYNVVDLPAATKRGIRVCNIPAYSTPAVAQHVFALILELCSHVGAHAEAVKNGAWVASKDFCFWNYPLVELQGKTLCVFGFGAIGRMVAKIGLAFGMKVVAVAHHPEKAAPMEGVTLLSRETAFQQADIISLNCPLNEGTREIICEKNIAGMKKGVWIINTARGPLVNTTELVHALNTGAVGAYAADVTLVEPMLPDDLLLQAPNCLITPHIAWAPKESRQRLMDIAVSNVQAFLSGAPVNVVN